VRWSSSCRVPRIDVDVVVGQVATEHGGRAGAAVQVDAQQNLRVAHRPGSLGRNGVGHHAVVDDRDVAQPCPDGGSVERHAARADRLEDRPGFGSPPNNAVFTSGELATARPTERADSASAAPLTWTTSVFELPSASATTCRARSSHTALTASPNARAPGVSGWTGRPPAAPPANNRTVSLVLGHASTVTPFHTGTAWSRTIVRTVACGPARRS